jgi:predicted permease
LSGYRRFGLRNLAMVAQLTGSLMLLLVTGFMVIGFSKANSVETKLNPKTMILLSIDPVRDGYTPEKAQALFEKLRERLKTSAMVRSFALAAQPPFSIKDADDGNIQLTAQDSRIQKSMVTETVGAGYFAALNEPMLAGREFEETDQRSQDQRSEADGKKTGVVLPVVLNESAARGFFGSGNAIGKRLREDKQSYEIVGVVGDLKNGIGISQSILYVPLTERDFARPPVGGITIIVRSNARADALNSIRDVVAAIDPKMTIFNVQTLSEYLERSRYLTWSALRTYGGIGVFGLILSAIGLAGITAYAVAQRRREIGIRMALGARKTQVLRLVLRESTTLIAVGMVLGFAGAFAMAKILSAVTSFFADAYKVSTNDPRLLVGAPLLLAVVALLACYVPARKAAKVDPLKALQQE